MLMQIPTTLKKGNPIHKKVIEARRDSARPPSISNPKAGVQAHEKKAAKVSQKTYPFTHEIEFPAVGISAKHGKFLLVTNGENYAVLSVRNLTRQPKEELERLEALDINLILPQAQNEFLKRAQEAANTAPTFKVATQIGWFDDVFVTPSGVYPKPLWVKGMPKGWSSILVHLDAKDDDVHSRFRCSGSALKSQEIFRLCKGNSRLMFTAAFSFVGPICKPFGLRALGVQAVGDASSGKTVFGIIAGATWGGIPDSAIGFGSAWNGTPNGLEEYAPGHNQTLMVLDETSLMPTDEKGRVLSFGEALMRLMQGQGKKRFNSRVVERWSSPLISTSNFSVYHLLETKRRENYKAYVDRLIDIPAPHGSSSFFKNLHGFKDADTFGQYLFELATQSFGHPSRVFLTRFTAELEKNRKGLAAVVAGHIATYKAASEGISSPTRNVQRVCGYFATVYAAGCLAIRYKILPFSEPKLLDAIISCHSDHVVFVDAEVAGAPGWSDYLATTGGVGARSARKSIVGVPAPAQQPFDRLRRFVNDNRKGGFIDFRKPALGKAKRTGRRDAPVLGYIAEHDGRREYWIPGPTFKRIAGGAAEDRELKGELLRRGLLVTDRRSERVSFVVKRQVPGKGREYVVALRQKAAKR